MCVAQRMSFASTFASCSRSGGVTIRTAFTTVLASKFRLVSHSLCVVALSLTDSEIPFAEWLAVCDAILCEFCKNPPALTPFPDTPSLFSLENK